MKPPACQEQKLAFVINQFDGAVTEQSLLARVSSTPSTFPSAAAAAAVAQQTGEEDQEVECKWSETC